MGFTLTVDGDLIAPSGLPLLRKGEAASVRHRPNASPMQTRWQQDGEEQVRLDTRTDQSGNGVDEDGVFLSDESE